MLPGLLPAAPADADQPLSVIEDGIASAILTLTLCAIIE